MKKKPVKMYVTVVDATPKMKSEVIAEIDRLYTSTYEAGQLMWTVPLMTYTTSGNIVSRFAP